MVSIHLFESHLLYLRRYHLFIIISIFLYLPSLVCAQPAGHFNLSLLSPIQKGEYLLAQYKNNEALQLYQSIIIDGSEDEYAFRGLVRAYHNMKKLEQAESWIQGFLSNNLNSSPALYALGYVSYLKKNMGKAEQLLNQALRSNASNTLALNNLGAILAYKKLYKEAAEKVREAIQTNPRELMFFRNLEAIYQKMNNPNLIITDYNFYLEQGDAKIIRGYGMAVARNMRQAGFKFYSEGRLGDAIMKFAEIETVYKKIRHESGLVPIYFSLGLLYEEKGDVQNAKKYFNQVLSLNSMHIHAQERLKGL